MSDSIKFDFAKSQSMLDLLNESSCELSELTSTLDNEVNSAGQWWKGESYDAFKANYSGSGKSKSTIEMLSDRSKDIGDYLSKIADAKKEFERNTSKLFR